MLPITRNVAAAFRPTAFSIRLMSTKRIFVGNLPWAARTDEISALFAQYGEVKATRVMIDRATGRSRGFGFVEMEEEDAVKAISSLNGSNFKGRDLRVNEATETPDRAPREPRNRF
ncbi:hypothetical protein SpCBS45565_g02722 [Spizellomyces sp. 'palustris']|nr:hypothetical protein SpCBS45565_g02722 [Spizellomyces sp. 'palustris']